MLTVHVDVAPRIVRRVQAQVVTQRTCVRIAVAHQLRAGRQLGEHGGFDRANAIEQFDGAWAQLHGRGVIVAVPFEVEALPTGFEKRVETHVIRLL